MSPQADLIKVLIVDDDPLYRLALAAILADQDEFEFVVAEAEDGQPALLALERERADVLLLDLDMPRLHGIEVTKLVKRRWPDVRVVIVTNSDLEVDKMGAEAAGSDAFITKAQLLAPGNLETISQIVTGKSSA